MQDTAETRAVLGRAFLSIRGAALSEALFRTDRGSRTLPAWLADAVDARGPIWVLTQKALRRCWLPTPVSEKDVPRARLLQRAMIGAKETDLMVEFIGESEGLFDYEAETLETPPAVAVAMISRAKSVLIPGTPIAPIGYARWLRLQLAKPLGNRVLVDLDGSPVEVNSVSSTGEPLVH